MKRTACILSFSFAFLLLGCEQKSYFVIFDIKKAPEFVSEAHLVSPD